jgi:alkylhydroperoxidase family enzyme
VLNHSLAGRRIEVALLPFVADEVYQQRLGSPQVANLLRVLFHAPDWAEALMKLVMINLTGLELSALHREIVILETGRLVGGDYVWTQHVNVARRHGLSEEQLAALRLGEGVAHTFDASSSVLIAFVRALADGPRVSEAAFRQAREHFSDRQLVEIVGVHGTIYTVARITSAFDIEIDEIDGAEFRRYVEDTTGKGIG